jgi:hypothetical protein
VRGSEAQYVFGATAAGLVGQGGYLWCLCVLGSPSFHRECSKLVSVGSQGREVGGIGHEIKILLRRPTTLTGWYWF